MFYFSLAICKVKIKNNSQLGHRDCLENSSFLGSTLAYIILISFLGFTHFVTILLEIYS